LIDDQPGPLYPILQGTLPWQPILCQNFGKPTYVHAAQRRSKTECNIAVPIQKYSMTIQLLYPLQ